MSFKLSFQACNLMYYVHILYAYNIMSKSYQSVVVKYLCIFIIINKNKVFREIWHQKTNNIIPS